jgi:hypothetical protein
MSQVPITAPVLTSGLYTGNFMKGPPAFLAFDPGAESGRVVLGRLRGKPDPNTIFADRI